MNRSDIQAAARLCVRPRLPFALGEQVVGSVATDHLPLLKQLPGALRITSSAVHLDEPAATRTSWFATANAQLRAAGVIRAWRDETYSVVNPHSPHTALAHIERAGSRFWGTLTFGAHATGYLADERGEVTHLWIAQRSPHKATDPGLLDNLVGGGVPYDQTPHQALLRECWEEAGLPPELAAAAREAGVLELHRDIPEGFQHEHLHAFDLALPASFMPQNQDGEVAGFRCVAVSEVVETELWRGMTLDAALVTLDFLRRRIPDALSASDNR